MREQLQWAVLGTGVIANKMAAALKEMGKTLYTVGNRTYDKAVRRVGDGVSGGGAEAYEKNYIY